MRRLLDSLLLLASCVLGVVAFSSPAWGSQPPEYARPRSGASQADPLLGGLAALGFWWLWRRLREPHRQRK